MPPSRPAGRATPDDGETFFLPEPKPRATGSGGRTAVDDPPGALGQRARAHLREPLSKSAYSLILNTGANGLLGLVYWAVAARRYDAVIVGENAALVAGLQAISTVGQVDLAGMLMRFLPHFRATARRAVALAYLVAGVVSTALSIGFVLVAGRFLGNWHFLRHEGLAIVFCFSIVEWSIFAIEDGVLVGLQKATVVPLENTAFGIAKLAALLAFSGTFSHWGIFASWCLPLLLVIPPVNWLIFRRYLPTHQARPGSAAPPMGRRQMVRYISYDYVFSISGTALTMGMPLLALTLIGATGEAHFYVAWTFITMMESVTVSMGMSLLVTGSYEQHRLSALARQTLRRSMALLLPMVAVVVGVGPWILVLFGHDYRGGAATAFRILALGLVPRGLLAVYSAVNRVRGAVVRVAAVNLGWTLAVIAAVTGLGAPYGLNGIAVGYLIANLAGAVALGLLMLRQRNSTTASVPAATPA